MMSAIRKALGESHVATIAIAVLLLWSMRDFLLAWWMPGLQTSYFVATAIAIRGVPYMSPGFNFEDRMMVLMTSIYLGSALISFGAAWFLSNWVYGVGPFKCLSQYRSKLARRNRVA